METQPMEQALDGVFTNLKALRKIPYSPNNTDKNLIGIKQIKNIFYVKHSEGFVEVANKKLELLGVIYSFKDNGANRVTNSL